MFTRLQLPLFMAGIETGDVIYRDWISSKLWRGRYKHGLQQVLQLQDRTGTKASVSTIRQALCGNRGLPSVMGNGAGQYSLMADPGVAAPALAFLPMILE